MKQHINIYSSSKKHLFFEDILSSYTLKFLKLNDLPKKTNSKELGIILLSDIGENVDINFSNFSKFIFITNLKKHKDVKKENVLFIDTPVSPLHIKNHIKNFFKIDNLKLKNLSIIENKLINSLTMEHCYLTDIEKDILINLLINKKCSKHFVKNNILKIKSNIETNSLESHLSRIRGKFNKLKINLVLQSKNNNLYLF